MAAHYIGMMSGTSLDGADAVLAQLPREGGIQVLAHAHAPFPAELRAELLALNQPGANELHRAALAANGIARAYAQLVQTLRQQAPEQSVRAIGAHGQTVRHRPGEFDGLGYTLQLLNGALLAELTGTPVVCDFRSRDVAARGQGAPLVPAFHQAVFARRECHRAVLNIGGISNISLLSQDPAESPLGFDCGPGNCLMDEWIQRHQGLPYDADGAWAASGRVVPALLQALLAEPFLQLPPPRSTGRDLFHSAWLHPHLERHAARAPAQDVQATLLEFSAEAMARSLRDHGPTSGELLVCGGGALNRALMQRLQELLPRWQVQATDTQGLPAMQVEAAAFAWLAMRHCETLPGNLSRVTGASGPRVLGAYHPA